jgi:ABC-type multidrug transport system fused ATPase/permease subunit
VVASFAASLAGQLVFGYLSNRVMWGATYEVVGALRLRLVEHLARLPLGFHAARRAGDTLTAATADLQSVENYQANALPQIVGAICAPVLVLDEATAFADPDSEAAIQEALGRLATGRTVLVVAHRLSTIAGADQILVVEDGRIVERGGHDELLEAGGRYAALWRDFTAAQQVALGDAVRGAREVPA